MANTLAYYDTVTITAVKSFIVQAPGGSIGTRYVCNFYLTKNHKIAKNSATNEDRENKQRFGILTIIFKKMIYLANFENYQILLNKISHRFLFSG